MAEDNAAIKQAQSIYDAYYIICMEYTEEIQCSLQAKKCALKHIDGLIDICHPTSRVYYQEIKLQIEKLN